VRFVCFISLQSDWLMVISHRVQTGAHIVVGGSERPTLQNWYKSWYTFHTKSWKKSVSIGRSCMGYVMSSIFHHGSFNWTKKKTIICI
jgi:hypothetical protein